MNKSKLIFKLNPVLIIILALVFAGSVAYASAPKSPVAPEAQTASSPKVIITPSPHPQQVLGASTVPPLLVANPKVQPTPSSTPKSSISSSPIPSANTSSSNSVNNPTPTSTPTPTSSPSPSSSPTPSPTVAASIANIEVKTPNSDSNFSVEINDGMNVCDVMQKAKDEGKINSITFDDSYLAAYKSRYISEINGYKDNWTFTVNGSSPLGCSLSTLKPNDSIVWKFG